MKALFSSSHLPEQQSVNCVYVKRKRKKHDIESTIKRLKNNKIPGKNGFRAELLCTSNKSSRH